ncbi:MAG: helix-turn-helix domain-containing protein [Myxococcota bacterium]
MVLVFHHELLATARLELGLTQEQAAAALQIDVRTYRRYETGAVNDAKRGFSVRRAGRRQLLARIGRELGIATEELVRPREDGPAPAAPSPASFTHVLQPAQHFVGRERELDELRRWATGVGPRIVAVVAMGGAGKSALCQRLLDDRSEDGHAPPLVWSFYDDARIEGFMAAALRHLGAASGATAPLEVVEQLLAQVGDATPRLLVLDGLEAVQSTGRRRPPGSIVDAHLRRLLSSIAGSDGGTRVLVTSRSPLVDLRAWEGRGLRTMHLGPLDEPAQLELLRRWGIDGTQAQASQALSRYGGHALTVATLASYAAGFHEGSLASIPAIDLSEAASDDLLAFRLARVLEAYAGSMTEAQRDLVARVSLFPRGADVPTLLSMTRAAPKLAGAMPQHKREVVRTLSQLETMGVIYRNREAESVFSAHPFVAEHFRRELGHRRLELHEALRRQLAERIAAAPRPGADLVEDLLMQTLLAGDPEAAVSLYERRLGGFDTLGLERGEMARGQRVVRGFFLDGDPAQPRPGTPARAIGGLLYDLALFSNAMGDPRYARLCLEHFVDRVQASPRAHVTGWRTKAYVLRLEGRLDEARTAIERALELSAAMADHHVRNLALCAAIEHDRGDFDAAAQLFSRANTIDPRPRFRRALWEAEHLVDRQRYDEAATIAGRQRETCRRLGWSGHISHCEVVLGHCEVQHDPEAAARLLADARPWAYRSGEVEAQLRCMELALRLCATDDEAAELRTNSLELARSSSYGRFEARLAESPANPTRPRPA